MSATPNLTLEFEPINVCDWAEHSQEPPSFIRPTRYRGARARGVKYESKVREHLARKYTGRCYPSQWIRFRADGKERIRWCQPDNIIVDEGEHVLTIVEVKYQHTDAAWWQLFHLYRPVVSRLFHGLGYDVRCVEIVHWFDPSVRCTEKPYPCPSLEDVRPGAFNVHILNPERL